jgi:hypothetical protein
MSDKNSAPGEYRAQNNNIWMRGLHMLIFAIFFGLAETVLFALVVLQFLWMVFAKEKNTAIVDFGHSLGLWMAQTVDFQTAKTDEKPFPWKSWGS